MRSLSQEDTWLFPSEDAFLAVLDPYDSLLAVQSLPVCLSERIHAKRCWRIPVAACVRGEFLDADALWQLLSDRRGFYQIHGLKKQRDMVDHVSARRQAGGRSSSRGGHVGVLST